MQYFHKRHVLFHKETNMANYADDNTLFSVQDNIERLLSILENETNLDWFRKNEMKPNDDKCHLIVCNEANVFVNLGNENIVTSDSIKLK